MYRNDIRTVITLDAGGTNLVFGAMQAGKFIIEPISLPANAHDLDKCLQTIVSGFSQVIEKLKTKPVAISFAFPGPADYPRGIIGGYLPNFPSFRDGVALGPFLEDKFGIPVFINNDGDLFAYGEALGGMLPEINERLEKAGSQKRYHNLIGYTLGTGLGIGTIINNKLNRGDNSCVETFCLQHNEMHDVIVEDGVSIRAIKRLYGELSGCTDHNLTPRDICEIADGTREGDQKSAQEAFAIFGRTAGSAITVAANLIDGLVVLGGGITAAHKWFMPALLGEMRSKLRTLTGDEVGRIQMNVYNLDDPEEFEMFARGNVKQIKVYGSDRTVPYDTHKRIGVAISKLGANHAVSVGAYSFALNELDKKENIAKKR